MPEPETTESLCTAGRADWRQRAEACAAQWKLEIESAHPEQGTAQIVYCSGRSGPSVMKIGIEPGMIEDEVRALRWFGHIVCPEVFEFDEGRRAILMERIVGDGDLVQLYPDADAEVAAWLPLYREVVGKPEVPEGFRTLADFADVFDRTSGKTGRPEIDRVLRIASDRRQAIIGEPHERRLLHGDMHHFNVLHDSRRGWRLIDPHGVVGHPLYEVGAYLRNPWPNSYTEPGVEERLRGRIAAMATALDEPASLIALYAFYGAAISLAWDIEEGTVFAGMALICEAALRLEASM